MHSYSKHSMQIVNIWFSVNPIRFYSEDWVLSGLNSWVGSKVRIKFGGRPSSFLVYCCFIFKMMSLYHGGRQWDIDKLNDFKFYFYDISIRNAFTFLSEELACQYFRYLFVLTFSKIYAECNSCVTEHIHPVSFPWCDLAFLIISKAQEGSTLHKDVISRARPTTGLTGLQVALLF